MQQECASESEIIPFSTGSDYWHRHKIWIHLDLIQVSQDTELNASLRGKYLRIRDAPWERILLRTIVLLVVGSELAFLSRKTEMSASPLIINSKLDKNAFIAHSLDFPVFNTLSKDVLPMIQRREIDIKWDLIGILEYLGYTNCALVHSRCSSLSAVN